MKSAEVLDLQQGAKEAALTHEADLAAAEGQVGVGQGTPGVGEMVWQTARQLSIAHHKAKHSAARAGAALCTMAGRSAQVLFGTVWYMHSNSFNVLLGTVLKWR